MASVENKSDEFKELTILVNAREKQWLQKSISFEQVVVLAFGLVENNDRISYAVIYKKGANNQEGIMVAGKEVKVKDGMRFNVTQTSRS
ncbi:MAG: multiubiquitin domain-containing protein [Lutibacter sp.]